MEKKRNLWVIPTDKPSRLVKIKDNLFLTTIKNIPSGVYQNIYITSDEEIKEGDWFIRDGSIHKCFRVHKTDIEFLTSIDSVYCGSNTFWSKEFCKKIVLTTDPQLIKDGVQAIRNEFLEWFVNNSDCDEIKTRLSLDYKLDEFGNAFWGYDIIIPKEVDILELGQIIPKEEPIDDEFNIIVKPIYKKTFKGTLKISPKEEPKQDEIIYFQKGKKYIQQDGVVILAGEKETNGMVIIDPKNTRGIGHYSKDWNPKAFKFYTEPKQETLEEAAIRFYKESKLGNVTQSFIEGAKWQQERISELRDELYNELPTGEIHAFDLIKIINNHIKKLDEL